MRTKQLKSTSDILAMLMFGAITTRAFKGLDGSITFDYMPSQYITFRMEYNHRASNVPYWWGKGGVTPPGGNTGPLGSFVPGWAPDLVKQERRYTMAILVKF